MQTLQFFSPFSESGSPLSQDNSPENRRSGAVVASWFHPKNTIQTSGEKSGKPKNVDFVPEFELPKEQNEEQMLYSVPEFDPFVADFGKDMNFEELFGCAEFDFLDVRNGAGFESREAMKIEEDKPFLKLDHGGVISAWNGKKSPWLTRVRPKLESIKIFSDFLGANGVIIGEPASTTGGSREARVSRYREKRQSRLFQKTIRYEVQKLNAQNQPTIKGRFVKHCLRLAEKFDYPHKEKL